MSGETPSVTMRYANNRDVMTSRGAICETPFITMALR